MVFTIACKTFGFLIYSSHPWTPENGVVLDFRWRSLHDRRPGHTFFGAESVQVIPLSASRLGCLSVGNFPVCVALGGIFGVTSFAFAACSRSALGPLPPGGGPGLSAGGGRAQREVAPKILPLQTRNFPPAGVVLEEGEAVDARADA